MLHAMSSDLYVSEYSKTNVLLSDLSFTQCNGNCLFGRQSNFIAGVAILHFIRNQQSPATDISPICRSSFFVQLDANTYLSY